MKPGTVISKDNGMFVVTRLESGSISKIECLEHYVARNVMIKYNDDFLTLKEIIDIHCDEYLSQHEVIKK